MKIGFLVWNKFQVAHAAEIARHFDEPEFVFIDRDPRALNGFDPAWLVPYGAYCRFLPELALGTLDGKYDAIVSQFRPPLKDPWTKTRMVLQQYSLAKPKTAYNARWFAADHALVYGRYSESIIGGMCPATIVGNPRFDPLFEGRLDPANVALVRKALDPSKRTILYLPTWGDLSSANAFAGALGELSGQFNVVVVPHHMTPLKDRTKATLAEGLIHAREIGPMLDPVLHLLDAADLVVSDMSGAIFDGLYCHKPVVLVGGDEDYSHHRKADPTALEVVERDHIGPWVRDPSQLASVIADRLQGTQAWREANEALVERCFGRRGGGAAVAAEAIRACVHESAPRPPLQLYAAPDFTGPVLAKAHAAAKKRQKQAKRRGGSWKKLALQGDFFNAGLTIELWRKRDQATRVRGLYQARNAVSAVRYSPGAWKGEVARIFRGVFAPSTRAGRELLREFGMLTTAAAWYTRMEGTVPPELQARIEGLGPLAGVLDVASRNEVTGEQWQECIAPSGELRQLDEVGDEPLVQLYLLLSLARGMRDEEQRPYRASQLAFSQNLLAQLLALGATVHPRIQAGIVGATQVPARGDAITWHTLGNGRPGQLHVKIGTLYGYFIVDSKGYSGWSSIADASLGELVAGVDGDVADAHWRRLAEELVSGGKSKYSQAESEVPASWGDYVFLPMQVADDTVARLADIPTLALLEELAAWARTSRRTVVVKRHPMCRSKAVAEALREAEREGLVHVSDANIHQLVAGASCVVTVNSGVGAEALLQLKPVVTTGASDYAAATRRVRTVDELREVLDSESWTSATDEQIKKFIWFYTKRYMVRYDDGTALRERLSELLPGLAGAKRGMADPAGTALRIPTRCNIPFNSDGQSPARTVQRAQPASMELGPACSDLLRTLRNAGVACWLDSGSLLGLVRYGRLNDWEKDIDLGIWVEDYAAVKAAFLEVAERHGLWYREKWVRGLPQALLLSDHPGSRSTLPLSAHVFFRRGEFAWSPQPYSLVSGRAKYPRFIYRDEANGAEPATRAQKLRFLLRHPKLSLCIAAEMAGYSGRIGKALKLVERGTTLREKLLMALFTQSFEWKIPARYFDHLEPAGDPAESLLLPGSVDQYLTERYGEWQIPVQEWFYVVDDGCIAPIRLRELKQAVEEVAPQFAATRESR